MKLYPAIKQSEGLLDNEELVDKAYDGLIAQLELINADKKDNKIYMNLNNGGRAKDMNVFLSLLNGIYMPGSKRDYWVGTTDPSDFPLPLEGSIYLKPEYEDVEFRFCNIKRIRQLPKSVRCGLKKPDFVYKAYDIKLVTWEKDPIVDVTYFCGTFDGELWSTHDKLKLRDRFYRNFVATKRLDLLSAQFYGPQALSLLSDRKYLWNIRTKEQIRDNLYATINFGVEPDLVKSLLYARDNPLTATGRKRPILHWVRQHKRRLKSGINIDIKKHLRGVTEFEMGDLLFQITEPVKGG